MAEDITRKPATADLLGQWRTARRLSKQRLSELSDVSATYVRTIESGFDDDGRPVVPSATVIQKLSRGLARTESDPDRRLSLEKRAYLDFMVAAGYIDPESLLTIGDETSSRGLHPESAPPDAFESDSVGLTTDEPAAPMALYSLRRDQPPHSPTESTDAQGSTPMEQAVQEASERSVVISLRDQRLWKHCHDILNNWESLSQQDQELILGIMEFVAWRQSHQNRS